MKKNIFLLLILFLASCQIRNNKETKEEFSVVKPQRKLEELLSYPQDTILDYYDLSNDFLMEFPDLFGYTIRSINLSHNYLDTIIALYLPKGIKVLDASYNYIVWMPAGLNPLKEVEELYLSHNYIKYFYTHYFINRIDISYNKLYCFHMQWSYMYHYKM